MEKGDGVDDLDGAPRDTSDEDAIHGKARRLARMEDELGVRLVGDRVGALGGGGLRLGHRRANHRELGFWNWFKKLIFSE